MAIDFERAPKPLTGANVSEKAKQVLPAQYARFHTLGGYTAELGVVRDLLQFPQSYDAAWIGVCMQIDRKAHRELPGLSLDSQQPAERLSEIAQYWDELAGSSIYPFYTQTRTDLRRSKYSTTALEAWEKPHTKPSDIMAIDRNTALVAKIFPSVWNGPLQGKVWQVNRQPSGGPDQNIYYLHKEIEKHCEPDLLQYAVALQFLVGARNLSVGRVASVAKLMEKSNDHAFTYEVPDPKTTITKLLKRTEPYYLFSVKMSKILREREQVLFGEDADTARTLWTSATHLRLGRIVRPSGGSYNTLREPLVALLADSKYPEATYYVEELMARFPGILPEFVADKLEIEPDALRNLYLEERGEKAVPLTSLYDEGLSQLTSQKPGKGSGIQNFRRFS